MIFGHKNIFDKNMKIFRLQYIQIIFDMIMRSIISIRIDLLQYVFAKIDLILANIYDNN